MPWECCDNSTLFHNFIHDQLFIVAECLSTRLLIVQCSRLTFVCIYIYVCMYVYIYLSPFNYVGAVSVVSSPYYKPRSTGSRRDRARVEVEQARPGPRGSGPTRRRSTCEKDRARAEMEQERSERDRAREQK